MDTILITAGMFLLILVSLFLLLVVLMQRANANAGLGAAFGGGLTDSAFGTETGNILTKATRLAAIVFFVLSLGLYLLILNRFSDRASPDAELPTFEEVGAGIMSQEALDAAAVTPDSSQSLQLESSDVPTTLDAGGAGAEQNGEVPDSSQQ